MSTPEYSIEGNIQPEALITLGQYEWCVHQDCELRMTKFAWSFLKGDGSISKGSDSNKRREYVVGGKVCFPQKELEVWYQAQPAIVNSVEGRLEAVSRTYCEQLPIG